MHLFQPHDRSRPKHDNHTTKQAGAKLDYNERLQGTSFGKDGSSEQPRGWQWVVWLARLQVVTFQRLNR